MDDETKTTRRCRTCAWLDRETVQTLCGRDYGRCEFGPVPTWLRFARVNRVAVDGGEDCPAWREVETAAKHDAQPPTFDDIQELIRVMSEEGN